MIDRRTALRAAVIAGLGGAAAACGSYTATTTLRLAAGEEGGFFWEFAQLTAAAAHDSAIRLEPVRTAGSVDNIQALVTGQADIALSLADSVTDIPERPEGLTAIGRVYENYMQLAVLRDSPIRTTDQLRGARISLGASGSGAQLSGERITAAAGLVGEGAFDRTHLLMRDAAAALVSGEVDAVLWAGGIPTPAFAALGVSLRLLDLSGELAELRERYGPLYDRVVVPAGTYGQDEPVVTIGLANYLLAGPSVTNESAGALVDLAIDHAAELVPVQAIGSQFLDLQSLPMTSGVRLHPGAEEAYRRHHG